MLARLIRDLFRFRKNGPSGRIDRPESGGADSNYRSSPEQWLEHARALEQAGEMSAAIDCFHACVVAHPDLLDARLALANALAGVWRVEESLEHFTHAVQLPPQHPEIFSNYLLWRHLAVHPQPQALSALHRHYGELMSAAVKPRCEAQYRGTPDPERPLRIGYVSRNFLRHSVGFFIEPVIAQHDRSRYRVYCYYTHEVVDETTQRIAQLADVWRHVNGDDDDTLAARISDDEIDILVDLGGHTKLNRLGVFARKPAPVQMTWIGYPDTTGLCTIDYRITDAIADPAPRADAFNTERLLRLDAPFLCYQPPLDSPAVTLRDSGTVTFGSFNMLAKLNDPMVALWARILDAVPGSRVLLKSSAFKHGETVSRVRERFGVRGVGPERVEVRDWMADRAQHLAAYGEIDIALDTFPYNGTTTTCEALWMGVPVVTLAGEVHMSRVGATLLASAGLRDLVAESAEDYVRIAVALARDATRRRTLRSDLRQRLAKSPLFDHAAFAGKLERGMRQAWRQWCESQSPARPPASLPESPVARRPDHDPVAATTLTLVDGARIVVPDSLELITPYVLREQLDWFEDEIKFLRRVLRQGDRVIDIGANYGVYALSMAQSVGPAGHVWAFEPASGTAAFLAASIAANRMTQVTLERCALSSAKSTAQLALHGHSELNALVRDAPITGASETVPVATLDEYLETHDWRDIAFVKVDAEGEEANILLGGTRFFAECSPLVQYEIKAGADLHMELVQAFAEAGYASYRLVPGLDLLVSFDTQSPPDNFLLNLFCCKPERAADLAARGFLVESAPAPARPRAPLRKAWARLTGHDPHDWRSTIAGLPYAAQLAHLWEKTAAAGGSREVEAALALHACSRDASLPARERYAALDASFRRFKTLCEDDPSYLRLASFARIARDYGARATAANALAQLANSILQGRAPDAREPFLAPAARFDAVAPGAAPRDWVLAAALEEYERLGSFSSFYTGDTARNRLEMIRDLGFGSAEMQRRLLLLHQRFGSAA